MEKLWNKNRFPQTLSVVLLTKSALGSVVIWEDTLLWEGYFFMSFGDFMS